MSSKDTRPLPAVQLADLEGYLKVMHAGASGRDRPLWAALRDLAALIGAILRRLPPEG